MRRYVLISCAVLLSLFLVACSLLGRPISKEPTATPTPTESPAEPSPTHTPTPAPTATPEPTDTPPAESAEAGGEGGGEAAGEEGVVADPEAPVVAPVVGSEILIGEVEGSWGPAIGSASLIQGVYQAILETAAAVEAGTLTDEEALEELLAQALVLEGVEQTLGGWDASDIQLEYEEELETLLAQAQGALAGLIDEELTPLDVTELLEVDLETLSQTTQEILEAASLDGVEVGDIQETLDQISDSIDEILDVEINIPLP
jgi:hypothetical protein